jgi:diapolycopene oxygenase
MDKSASIIGSGIGGLAIALRLKAKGYNVDVFEKAGYAGGKLAQHSIDGYRFDAGPSLFTLPGLVAELFELFGKKMDDYLETVVLDTSCNYYFPDGSQLKAWANKERFVDEVEKHGVDTALIEDYLHRQSFLYQNTSDFFLFQSIHKLNSYTGNAGRRSLRALHRLDAFTSMHHRNESFFGKSNLVQLFDRYATYNGSNPYKAPATLNMIAHLEHNTGAYFPKNGMYSIITALTKLASEVGIRFYLNTEVTGLLFNNKRVAGIQTVNGNQPYDLVVNDTDILHFYRTIFPDKRMQKRLMQRERSSSALIFHWGVNFSSNLDVHNIFFSHDYRAEFDGLFVTKRFANDLTVYVFISKKVVSADAPEGCENWFVMVNAPENVGQDWASETAKAKKIIVQKINDQLKIDIEKYIQNEHITTPVDIENRTASVNGSLYGHSSNSAFAAFLRHPNFSRKYRNLFFVGGSVHPGGGIPLCLASAKIVGEMVKPMR